MSALFALVQFFLFRNFPSIYHWSYLLYKRISDANRFKWIKENIKEGMVVLDVGANVGDYIKFLAEIVGKTGKVYAFEPDPLNFAYLKKYAGNYPNVIIENVAVGEKDGTIKLYQSKKLNVDHQTFDSGESRKSIVIPCISLDSYLKDHKVDLLKIDIQGYDYIAMKGATKILAENKKMFVIGEFWPYGLSKAGSTPKEYLELLKNNGFTVEVDAKALTEEVLTAKNYYTDFIAIKDV